MWSHFVSALWAWDSSKLHKLADGGCSGTNISPGNPTVKLETAESVQSLQMVFFSLNQSVKEETKVVQLRENTLLCKNSLEDLAPMRKVESADNKQLISYPINYTKLQKMKTQAIVTFPSSPIIWPCCYRLFLFVIATWRSDALLKIVGGKKLIFWQRKVGLETSKFLTDNHNGAVGSILFSGVTIG